MNQNPIIKKSGLIYGNWVEIFEESIEPQGEKEICNLMLATMYIVLNRHDDVERIRKKLSKVSLTQLKHFYPLAEANIKKYSSAITGGRPVNYTKNIDICVRKLQKEFHDKTFKGLLDAWFEHLNKHSVSTKKDVLQHTISEFGRLASGVDHAIRLLKKNIAEENLEFDYEAAAVSGLDDEESEEIKLELDDELEELELGDGK